MDTATFSAVCLASFVVLVVWLLGGPLNRQPYRCSKCGFETYSEIEANGHEKQENAHKCA